MMTVTFDLDEILAGNPQVSPDELRAARDLLRRLREHGLQRKEYDLTPPFGGRRVQIQEAPESDPRVVRLRSG